MLGTDLPWSINVLRTGAAEFLRAKVGIFPFRGDGCGGHCADGIVRYGCQSRCYLDQACRDRAAALFRALEIVDRTTYLAEQTARIDPRHLMEGQFARFLYSVAVRYKFGSDSEYTA